MIKGIDLSRHNKNMKDLNDIKKYDFAIIKVSEGIGYRDQSAKLYTDVLKDSDTIIGYYHFVRADLGHAPELEAENFINAVRSLKLPYNPILAVDVEARSLDEPFIDVWTEQFCRCVYNYFGYLPLLYTSEAYVKLFKKTCALGVGLWVAKWSNNKPKKIKPWDFFAIWQYTSNAICSGVRVDENYFNGNRKQLLKYAEVLTDEETTNS